jgi:hypothetical protein
LEEKLELWIVYISILVSWVLSLPVIFFLYLWTSKPTSIKKANCSIFSVILFYLSLWTASVACGLNRIDLLDSVALVFMIVEMTFVCNLCSVKSKMRREAQIRK